MIGKNLLMCILATLPVTVIGILPIHL